VRSVLLQKSTDDILTINFVSVTPDIKVPIDDINAPCEVYHHAVAATDPALNETELALPAAPAAHTLCYSGYRTEFMINMAGDQFPDHPIR